MTELLNLNMYHFLMVFLRLGSAIMLMPGFMSSYISANIRLSIALGLSIILMPAIAPHLPPQPADIASFITYVLQEITIGVFLGAVMQMLYAALSLAGSMAGQAIGFGNAQIFDPTFQTQSVVVETFLSIIALTVIFLTDIHHLMISAVVDSYHIFPVGAALPWGDFANQLSTTLNSGFIAGFKIASPFVAFTIVFYTGMGLVSRLMPQLNIFFLSLPLQIYLGLGLLFITTPMMILWFSKYYNEGLLPFLH